MEFLNEKAAADWARFKSKNTDVYGSAVVRFCERWADLMEARLAEGATVALIARATSRKADSEGITGFMHGWAVQALVKWWAHGEDLRRWHNTTTQLSNEGDRANESGAVIDPATVTVRRNRRSRRG